MHQPRSPAAVVLLSGGLDSATALAMARADGFDCHCLSVRYGQRHEVELDAAARVVASAGVADHRIAEVDLRLFGGSALTDHIAVPRYSTADDVARVARSGAPAASGAPAIPITYVPARNTILLSFALAFAEVIGAADVFIGVNALDYSGYPDCRPEFIEAFERMANLATKAGVEGSRLTIHTPLIAMTKAEIILAGSALGVDYSLTFSCYDPVADPVADPADPADPAADPIADPADPADPAGPVRACGRCASCLLRAKGFVDAGVADPTLYV